jgi:hypothetical protein
VTIRVHDDLDRGVASAISRMLEPASQVGLDTIDLVVSRAQEQALRQTFIEWPGVQSARKELERIRR